MKNDLGIDVKNASERDLLDLKNSLVAELSKRFTIQLRIAQPINEAEVKAKRKYRKRQIKGVIKPEEPAKKVKTRAVKKLEETDGEKQVNAVEETK